MVVDLARGILVKYDRTSLKEFGGLITLTKGCAKQFLRRLGYTKRRGSSKAKILPGNFKEIKYFSDVSCSHRRNPSRINYKLGQHSRKREPSTLKSFRLIKEPPVEVSGYGLACVLICTMSGHFLPV